MNYRYMRLILFFDLPMETSLEKRDYRKFVKEIRKLGFYMLQKSVYIKLSIDAQNSNKTISLINKLLPKDGNIAVLSITEKQFNDIEFLLGESSSDVISDDLRFLEL